MEKKTKWTSFFSRYLLNSEPGRSRHRAKSLRRMPPKKLFIALNSLKKQISGSKTYQKEELWKYISLLIRTLEAQVNQIKKGSQQGHNPSSTQSLSINQSQLSKWQPTPVFLPGESQGRGSLVGCCLWGRTESDTTEATQQQQQHSTIHPCYTPCHSVKDSIRNGIHSLSFCCTFLGLLLCGTAVDYGLIL